MKNTKITQFINTATEEDWKKLAALVNSAPNKSKALPTAEYEFSYSAISKHLEDKGLLVRAKRKSSANSNKKEENEKPCVFIITKSRDDKVIGRSLQLFQGTYERFKQFENDHKMYRQRDIVNQLLDDGLAKYGY